jgi:undecaprenyl-diphosphatase
MQTDPNNNRIRQEDGGKKQPAHDGAAQFKVPVQEAIEGIQEQAQKEVVSPTVHRYRAVLFQGYVLVTLVAFSILAFLANTRAYFSIDLTLTRALQTFHPIWFLDWMRFISWFGYNPQVVPLTLAIVLGLYFLGLHREARLSLGAGLGTMLLNTLIKIVVGRPRPSVDLVEVLRQVGNYSFPSGHVMYYTAFYGFLTFLVYSLMRHSWRRTLLLIFFGMLVALVGVSRMYLGAHWASDVLAGYLLGTLVLAGVIMIYRRGKNASKAVHSTP